RYGRSEAAVRQQALCVLQIQIIFAQKSWSTNTEKDKIRAACISDPLRYTRWNINDIKFRYRDWTAPINFHRTLSFQNDIALRSISQSMQLCGHAGNNSRSCN